MSKNIRLWTSAIGIGIAIPLVRVLSIVATATEIESGCHLGWLLDPKSKRAAIYRQGKPPELLTVPESLSSEDVLPAFLLNAIFLWS